MVSIYSSIWLGLSLKAQIRVQGMEPTCNNAVEWYPGVTSWRACELVRNKVKWMWLNSAWPSRAHVLPGGFPACLLSRLLSLLCRVLLQILSVSRSHSLISRVKQLILLTQWILNYQLLMSLVKGKRRVLYWCWSLLINAEVSDAKSWKILPTQIFPLLEVFITISSTVTNDSLLKRAGLCRACNIKG